jgi:hypothetical protein
VHPQHMGQARGLGPSIRHGAGDTPAQVARASPLLHERGVCLPAWRDRDLHSIQMAPEKSYAIHT